MLDEAEQELFARLSVFVSGASLESIEQVCVGASGADPFDTLTSLVEKSLVRQREGIGGEPRFGMLETIREFAIDQAQQRGQWDSLRERHARRYSELARQSGQLVMGSSSREWLDRFALEHDNLRAALAWTMANDTELALRLVHDLWRFWQRRGHLVEGIERAEAALALPAARDHPEARADALSAAAGLAYWLADAERSREHYAAEIAAREELGDRLGLAEAEYGTSFTWSILQLAQPGTAANAEQHINAALQIYREEGDESGIGRSEWALANVYWGSGRLPEARRLAEHALEVFKSIDDRFMVGWASYTIGLAALSEGLSVEEGDRTALDEAGRRFRDALRTFEEAEDVSGYTLVLDSMAALAVRRGDRVRAATLVGAVSMLERSSGTALNLWNRDALSFDPDTLRADPVLAGAIADGEAMTTPEAVAYALSG